MLKYLKKQRSRWLPDDDSKSVGGEDVENVKRNSLISTSSFCNELFSEDETKTLGDDASGSTSIATSIDEDIFKYHSRLSMSLPAMVKDQNCLSHFVQYMEDRNSLPLIKFYMDTEHFRTAALTQLEIEQSACTTITPQEHVEHVSSSTTENLYSKSEDKNCVPELKTLCDLSMRNPLTDDEKSQIYAETTKQLTKCSSSKLKSCSEQSCSECCAPSSEAESVAASAMIDGCFCATASINDAMIIYQKYLRSDSQQFVSLPVAILSQISLLLCKHNDVDPSTVTGTVKISADCFVEAQQHVLKQMEDEFLIHFLQSTYYCKYCIELIENAKNGSGTDITIFDVLYSEVTLFFFMEYLEQHKERDCLDFWSAAINFRKSYTAEEDTSPLTAVLKAESTNEVQADAMIIYEKYFSLQSDSRLWLSDRIRCKVEESICEVAEVGKCFDLPLIIIAKYLEQKYLENFLKSQLFENYFNELKSKVHEEPTTSTSTTDGALANELSTGNCVGGTRTSRHRKTMSDCTNSGSRAILKHISQHNTLLAMETKSNHLQSHTKLQHAAETSDLSIDVHELTNPKALWQRSSTANGDLKFGQINELGRYERDFDDVDSWANTHKNSPWSLTTSGNKIKNAMRKLVNLPEEKVQEEIAWQVAEMIIKDVTTVTLGDDNSKPI